MYVLDFNHTFVYSGVQSLHCTMKHAINFKKIIFQILIHFEGQIFAQATINRNIEKEENIAKSEQSSHTPGGSHQRPYHFNWKERKIDK